VVHAAQSYRQFVSLAGLTILLVACGGGDGPTSPADKPGLHILLGAGVTDTVDAEPAQALVVEVREADGQFSHGAIVRFEARPPADSTRRGEAAVNVCPLTAPSCGSPSPFYGVSSQFTTDTTDAEGRAKAIIRLGSVAGRAVVRVTVPEFGMEDSAVYTVKPGAIARVHASAAQTSLTIGTPRTLTGRVVDRYNNTRPEATTLEAGAGTALVVDAATSVVTGREMGTQVVFTRYGSFLDTTSVRVVPAGRLVVWSNNNRLVRLVNLDGTAAGPPIVTSVSSDLGAFPRFDETRKFVTLYGGAGTYGGPPSDVIVVDTAGIRRRDIMAFSMVIAIRQLADGTVLVVGRQAADPAGYSLYSVASDNSVTKLTDLPNLTGAYGGADISHDGTRVAYVATLPTYTTELRVLTVATGATSVLEPGGSSPRWSSQGDRIAFLVGTSSSYYGSGDGAAVVINADGTGRRTLGNSQFSPGLAWSPDGAFLVGRLSTYSYPSLQLVRVSDAATVPLTFPSSGGGVEDYFQPDWR
jgi:hypothetical protein